MIIAGYPNKLNVFSEALEEKDCDICKVVDDTIDFMGEWVFSGKLTKKKYITDELMYAMSDIEKIITNEQVKQTLVEDKERKERLIKSIKDFIDIIKEFKLPDYAQQEVEELEVTLQNIQYIIPELKELKWADYAEMHPNMKTNREKLKYDYTSKHMHYASKVNIEIEKYNKAISKNKIEDAKRAEMLDGIKLDLNRYAEILVDCENFDAVENIVKKQRKEIKNEKQTQITIDHFNKLYEEYEYLMCNNTELECINSDENFLAHIWANQIIKAGEAKDLTDKGELEEAFYKLKDCVKIMRDVVDEYNGARTL